MCFYRRYWSGSAETFKQVPDSNVAKKAQEIFTKYFDASSDHAVNIEDAELQRVSYFLTESTKKVSVEFQFNKIFRNLRNLLTLFHRNWWRRWRSRLERRLPMFRTPSGVSWNLNAFLASNLRHSLARRSTKNRCVIRFIFYAKIIFSILWRRRMIFFCLDFLSRNYAGHEDYKCHPPCGGVTNFVLRIAAIIRWKNQIS